MNNLNNYNTRRIKFFLWGVISLILICILINRIIFFESNDKEYSLQTSQGMDNSVENEYTIELDKFGIKNDATFAVETSKGINDALQYAKEKGYEKIVFPKGEYLISELNPVVIDLKNVVIDLNQATFQINTNGLEKYSIIQIVDGAENIRLTNGIIRGDKDTHDYKTIKTPHEWGCGIVFKGGKDLEMDNITVTNVTGYGIYTESGTNSNRFDAVYTKNVVSGSISESGIMIESNKNSRTKEVYNISKCGEQFELGYTLGYQGYPYLKNKEYTSYFYDENMNFVEKKDCIQFKKVDIPKEAKYVHFVFPQDKVESNLGYCAWISNFKPPRNVILHDCIIKENRSLGLAFCGGQQWTIENNIFEGNGGNAPSFAVNFEDGWELMQDVIFKNNKFIDNDRDLVVCAGDNLKFEENKFTERVLIWPRATNYKFDGNNFNGGSVSYGSNDGKCIINGNYYNSTSIGTSSVANKVINYMLFNETIIDSTIYLAKGTRLINCDIKAKNTKFLIKNASIENSIIEVKSADIDNSKFKNSKITGANWNLRYSHYSEDCEIIDSNFDSQGDDKIYFKNSKFTNSKIRYSTWGPPSEVTFEGCNILNDSDVSFIELSAGRAELLTLINNKINNKSSKPIISIFDTSYTTPNGNIVLENNELIQENYPYILDGVGIEDGIVNFTDRNNSVTGVEILNPKYTNNLYFNINQN